MLSATQSPGFVLAAGHGELVVLGVAQGLMQGPGSQGGAADPQHHHIPAPLQQRFGDLADLFDDLGLVGQLHETQSGRSPAGRPGLDETPPAGGLILAGPSLSGRSLPGTPPWHNCSRGSTSCSGPTWGLRSASWTSRFPGCGRVWPGTEKLASPKTLAQSAGRFKGNRRAAGWS